MSDALGWLADALAAREAAGLRRLLRPRQPVETLVDLASNDYLGLSRDPEVVAAGVAALRRWGAGSTGSRLVTGHTTLHAELERALADFCGYGSALVFSSGYTANLGALTALGGRDTLVVSDARNHASLVDGARLASGRLVVTPHCDVAAVAQALAQRVEERALVVTDSLFSVDGDLAPLAELHAACRDHGAALLVDEAHAIGVLGPGGRGAIAAAGLAGEPDVVATVTLSKSLGSQGGAVLGPPALADYLANTSRTFIFDTGLAPAAAAAALAALRRLEATPGLTGTLRRRARDIAAAAHVATPAGAVVSVVLGEPGLAVRAQRACADHGLRVGCFRPPSVPEGTSRLRITARADLTDADLDRVRTALAHALPVVR